jgi:Cu+-exporting ATPase
MIFKIVFHFEDSQMYCANCSSSIGKALQNCFQEKKYSRHYLVNPSHTKKTTEISLDVENEEEANEWLKQLQEAVGDIGKDIKSVEHELEKKIETQVPEQSSEHAAIFIEEIADNTKPNSEILVPQSISLKRKLFCSLPFPTLIFGSSLMVAEHLSAIPEPSDQQGMLVNLGIGAAATAVTAWVGRHHFANAWRAATAKKKTSGAMDYLIVLGSLAAIIYSFLLISRFSSLSENNSDSTYFSLPLVILGLLGISHTTRDYLHAKIEDSIDVLSSAQRKLPRMVEVVPGEVEEEKQSIAAVANQLVVNIAKGTCIKILPGNIVPIDGTLSQKNPVKIREDLYGKNAELEKKSQEIIFAGSVNISQQPFLLTTICTASEILIRKAHESVHTQVQKNNGIVERAASYFFPTVLGIAAASSAAWGFIESNHVDTAVRVFLSVIFSACPCGFGLIEIIPSMDKMLAFLQGFLVREENTFTNLARVKHICVDKCGTLTKGQYRFSQIETKEEDLNKEKYLAYAILLEKQIPQEQRSAVADAILKIKLSSNVEPKALNCARFETNPINANRGGTAWINELEITIGDRPLLKNRNILIDPYWEEKAAEFAEKGRLPIFFAIAKDIRALLILDPVEENQQELRLGTELAIQWFLSQKIKVHLLTGDSWTRSNELLKKLQVFEKEKKSSDKTRLIAEHKDLAIIVKAEQTPQTKLEYIQKLQENGDCVFMVGDGVNDIPALSTADCGVVIDTLAPAASDAKIVLNGSLLNLVQLMNLSKVHLRATQSSVAIAFGLNGIALLFAAGVFYRITGMFLDPMITGGTMAFSSLALMGNIFFFKKKAEKQLQPEIIHQQLAAAGWNKKQMQP